MATTDRRQGAAEASEASEGALVRDLDRDKVGEVMGRTGPYVQLRPIHGGKEWDANPTRVQQLTFREALSAHLAVRNARSEGKRL